MKLNLVGVDTDVEITGVWVNCPYDPSIRFKIARYGNHKATAMQLQLTKERDDDISIEDLEQMQKKVIAHTVILDWEGLYDIDTVPPTKIKYSPATCLDLILNNKQLQPTIVEWLLAETRKLMHFIDYKDLEAIEKAKKSLAGDSNTEPAKQS